MADGHKDPNAEFVAELVKLDVKLPVNGTTEVGVIADADGRSIITIDVNGERDDAQVEQIAFWVVLAINTCGGFRAQRGQDDG